MCDIMKVDITELGCIYNKSRPLPFGFHYLNINTTPSQMWKGGGLQLQKMGLAERSKSLAPSERRACKEGKVICLWWATSLGGWM